MFYLTFQSGLVTVGIWDVGGKGRVQDDFLVWGPSDQVNKPAINRAIPEVEQPRLMTPLGIFFFFFIYGCVGASFLCEGFL